MSEAGWLCRVPLPALGQPRSAVPLVSLPRARGCGRGVCEGHADLWCALWLGAQQLQHTPAVMGAATQASAAAVPAVVTAARADVPVPQNRPGLLCRGGNVLCRCCGSARAVLVVKP